MPDIFFKMADKPWRPGSKTVDGKLLRPIAIQKSRRIRKKKTNYFYLLESTHEIYYNNAKGGVVFVPIARMPQKMQRYYEIFVEEPLTDNEKEWLKRNDYEVI